MYHQIVRGIVRQGFENISTGNLDPLLAQFAPDIHFTFAGEGHPLAADFHDRETVRAWFERLREVFPGFEINAERMLVKGPPWNTQVAVWFRVTDTLPDGSLYDNHGTQFLRIKWGKVVEDHLMDNLQIMLDVLPALASAGRSAAAAPPLVEAG